MYIATLIFANGEKEIWSENDDWDIGTLFRLLDKCQIVSFSITLAPVK